MDNIALVTGASRGLGAEVALSLGALGMRVAINYRVNSEAASEVADMLGDSMTIRADVSDPAAVDAMTASVRDHYGRLDVLVINAGITRDALLPRVKETDWDKVMDVNLKGSFNLCRSCVPLMKESDGGHIILISSRSALKGKAGQAAYAAAKAALLGMGVSLARELAQDNIRVNTIIPPYIDTDMGMESEQAMEMAQAQSVLGTIGDTAEVASFIAWLASTERITGQVFTLDSRI
jgi:3-oxoacyl-[acyl-carrier protein] reductase